MPWNRRKSLAALIAKEIITILRFGIVGLSATIVHAIIVCGIIKLTTLSPYIANAIAFCIAFGVSFCGHYAWTFRSPGSRMRAIMRFFAIAIVGFSFNMLVLNVLLSLQLAQPVTAAMIAVLSVPVLTFTLSRFWGFKVD